MIPRWKRRPHHERANLSPDRGVLLGMLLLLLAVPGVARGGGRGVTIDLCATPGTLTVPATGGSGA